MPSLEAVPGVGWECGGGSGPGTDPAVVPIVSAAVRIKDSGKSLRTVDDSSDTELWLESIPGRR